MAGLVRAGGRPWLLCALGEQSIELLSALMAGHDASVRLLTPTLRTARLCLRPVAAVDENALFAMHASAEVLRYWDAPPWTERERAQRFIARSEQMAQEGSGVRVAVQRACDGALLGWCALSRWNTEYRSAALGYCYDHAAWGHGYATEAAYALLQWAFDTSELNRVQAETDTRTHGVSPRFAQARLHARGDLARRLRRQRGDLGLVGVRTAPARMAAVVVNRVTGQTPTWIAAAKQARRRWFVQAEGARPGALRVVARSGQKTERIWAPVLGHT